jgi:hypothetical protein
LLIVLSLFIASLGNSLSLFDLNGASGWFQRVGCAGEGFEVCFVFLVGLEISSAYLSCFIRFIETYKRKSAVSACSDLRLVGVDKDSRMTERTAAAVAGDDSLLCPSHGLFVNQLNGGVWLGLYLSLVHV